MKLVHHDRLMFVMFGLKDALIMMSMMLNSGKPKIRWKMIDDRDLRIHMFVVNLAHL